MLESKTLSILISIIDSSILVKYWQISSFDKVLSLNMTINDLKILNIGLVKFDRV